MKKCATCHQDKPLDAFVESQRGGSRSADCRNCLNAKKRARRKRKGDPTLDSFLAVWSKNFQAHLGLRTATLHRDG